MSPGNKSQELITRLRDAERGDHELASGSTTGAGRPDGRGRDARTPRRGETTGRAFARPVSLTPITYICGLSDATGGTPGSGDCCEPGADDAFL